MVRHTQSSHTKSLLLLLITVVIGVGLNFLGRLLNTALGLPLYLDNVGTLLTAMTGGLVPGITVGFFSNLINGLKDPNSTYYAVISILIAVAAVACKKKGVMTRFPQVLPVVLLFALIGGVVGGVLTWLINGKDFGEGYAVELAAKIGDTLSIGYVSSNLLSCFLVDLVDKAAVTAVSVPLYLLLPEKLLDYYFMVIDPVSVNRQGHDEGIQYRTGIFYEDESQLGAIREVYRREEKKAGQKLSVAVEPLKNFFSAEEYHQKYLEKNPGGYCHIPAGYYALGQKK